MSLKPLIGGLLAALIVALALSLNLPAQATPTVVADCKVVTTTLLNRPDSGENGNNWALDALTRTTKTCETSPGVYHMEVEDEGSFETLAGESPGIAIKAIPAGIDGDVEGSASFNFTAPPLFATYRPERVSDTFSGTAPSSTGGWAKFIFDGILTGGDINNDWGWNYQTLCGTTLNEKWVNAAAGNSGDITGKDCPALPTPRATNDPGPSNPGNPGNPNNPGSSGTTVVVITPPNTGDGGLSD